MSVLIKGINVHRGRCWECPCLDSEYGECNVLAKDTHYVRDDECPLIELPEHGDLIEKDIAMVIIKSAMPCENMETLIEVERMLQHIVDAPVVIPAERSEDE